MTMVGLVGDMLAVDIDDYVLIGADGDCEDEYERASRFSK